MHIEKEQLEEAIRTSKGYNEAGRKLGCYHQLVKKLAQEYNIPTDHFKFGKAYDEMIGEKFEMLTVCEIRTNPRERRGRRYAYCQCDCGQYKEVRADGLKAGRYVSCGCHSHNRWNTVGNKNHAFAGTGEIRSSYFYNMKRGAESRKIDFDLTIEEAWDLFQQQEERCALTGVHIGFGRVYYPNETSASPDRIDSKKGYTPDNLQWVLKDINIMKGSFDNEYFIKLCNLVAQANPRDVSEVQSVV